jgi:hypothetical protein
MLHIVVFILIIAVYNKLISGYIWICPKENNKISDNNEVPGLENLDLDQYC